VRNVEVILNLSAVILAFYLLAKISGTWDDDDNIRGYKP
jgi:hypothetical protein